MSGLCIWPVPSCTGSKIYTHSPSADQLSIYRRRMQTVAYKIRLLLKLKAHGIGNGMINWLEK